MRWRVIALISLGVNVLLAVSWLRLARHGSASRGVAPDEDETAPSSPVRTNLIVRRQFFTWQEVESPDYPTYIANLRDIGCPEQTIRDIIIADVNALYARRRANELITADQQWWRSQPDPSIVRAAAEKARVLEEERRALLARLLGTKWETGDLVSLPRPTTPGVVLDGPILGGLPAETKQAVQEVNSRSKERLQAYLDAQVAAGRSADPAELAKLRQQTRTELAGLLSVSQLEEYLLRYSQNAANLRADFGQLRFFDPTPEEFRQVYRATDALDQQILMLAGATDPSSLEQRKALEAQREDSLKIALGARRFEEYRLLQDPLYQEAVAAARQAGTPDSVGALYAINLAAAAEQQRLHADESLTASQKALELKRLELEQLTANTLASGKELPPEPPAPSPPRKVHVAGPGDSLAVIAMIYGWSVNDIRAVNPNVDFRKLKPGDRVIIPPSPRPPVAAP